MAGIKELLEDVLKEAEGVSLGIDKNINDYLDTGNLALNKIISDDYFKGYPLGRIVELYGDPSTGKSMLIYQAMANWQKKYEEKAVCILDDTEDVFTEFVARIVGLDGSKVLVVSSETVEDHFETVFLGAKKKQSLVDRILSRNKDFKIIVALDSVAHLSTRHEKEVGLDKSDLSKAKQIRAGLRLAQKTVSSNNILYLISNHVYAPLSAIRPTKTTPGGKAIPFLSSVRIELELKQKIGTQGVVSKAFVKKNKVAQPFRSCELYIDFKTGLDRVSGVESYLVEDGLLKDRASWWELPDGKKIRKGELDEDVVMSLFKKSEKKNGK